MLDDVFVIGLAAYFTELLKKAGLPKMFVPLVVLVLAAVLNIGNGCLLGDVVWQEALKQGLTWGAVAGGIYGFGQAVKSEDKYKVEGTE